MGEAPSGESELLSGRTDYACLVSYRYGNWISTVW